MNSSKMKVDSVESMPRNMLMELTATKAVLGTLNKYEAIYITGVIAQLPVKQHNSQTADQDSTNRSLHKMWPIATNVGCSVVYVCLSVC